MQPKKRTGLLIGACVLVVFGAAFAAAGGTAIWADTSQRDDSGYFSTNAHSYQTRTRAIQSEKAHVGRWFPTWLAGKVRLDTSSAKPLFVGIAPKRTVDAYLARIDHAEATDLGFDPFKVTYEHHGGSAVPRPPAREPFWTASAVGTTHLTWALQSGDWSVVVMNADGSPGVSATVAAGVKIPALLWIGIGSALLGLSLLGGAAAMLYARSRSYGRAPTAVEPVVA